MTPLFCISGTMFELSSAGRIVNRISRARGAEAVFDGDLRSTAMKKILRLKKLINWTVQGPVVLRVVGHMVTYNIALFALLLMAWGMCSLTGFLAEETETSEYFVFKRDAISVLLCMAIITPYMVWDLISLTNRIAGPLYRFEALMKEFVRSGTLDKANLRQGDLLKGFQTQFNEFVEALHALYPETIPATAPSNDDSKSFEEPKVMTSEHTVSASSN
jgi:hypothetical protein